MNKYLLRRNYFSAIEKSNTVKQRLDKLNILEYFGIVNKRQLSRTEDMLLLELHEYFNSSLFSNEFKPIITNDIQKHKFFLMHVGLLSNRISNAVKADKLTSLSFRIKNKLLAYNMSKPIFSHSADFIKYYINKEFSLDNSPGSIVIEQELLNILSKEQLNYMKVNTIMLKILHEHVNTKNSNGTEDTSNIKLVQSFESKILKDYLLVNRDNLATLYCDKLFTYFTAHFNYLSTLSLSELLNNKVYWGLRQDFLISGKVDQ